MKNVENKISSKVCNKVYSPFLIPISHRNFYKVFNKKFYNIFWDQIGNKVLQQIVAINIEIKQK